MTTERLIGFHATTWQIETAYSWHLSFGGYFKSVRRNDESAGEGEGGDWDNVSVQFVVLGLDTPLSKTQLAASFETCCKL